MEVDAKIKLHVKIRNCGDTLQIIGVILRLRAQHLKVFLPISRLFVTSSPIYYLKLQVSLVQLMN